MNKIHVLHLSSEKTWRGGEQQIAYLIDELQKLGVENIVLARRDSVFYNYCREKNIRVESAGFKNSFDLSTASKIKAISTRENINVIHMHSAKSHAVGVLSAVLGNKVPLILSRRVDFVPKNNWLTKWKYNHSSIKKIVCVSHKIREIMQSYVSEPAKCITVHSGVDLHKFAAPSSHTILREEYAVPENALIVGNTSAMENHKDYPTFLRTINLLKKENIRIKAFIIGQGSMKDTLAAQVNALGLYDDVVFTGFRKDIQRVLPSLDIFLITSEEEGLGTSVLDAFAAGVPVVATNAGGIPEMVIHEKTGLIADVKDEHKLAANVRRIASDDTLRKSLVAGAKEKLEEFSKDKTAKKTLEVYRAILSQH